MLAIALSRWSFGRDRSLLNAMADEFTEFSLHQAVSDPDANRTIICASGEPENLLAAVDRAAQHALDRIDLNFHATSVSRLGALDQLHLMAASEGNPNLGLLEAWAESFAETFSVPVFLTDRSAPLSSEAILPALELGGFGLLTGRPLVPSFGPLRAHLKLGITRAGWRDFEIEFTVRVHDGGGAWSQNVPKTIERGWAKGDPIFLSVSAEAHALPTLSLSEVAFRINPKLTSADEVASWFSAYASAQGLKVEAPQLVGAIFEDCLDQAQRLRMKDIQIVPRVI